MRKAKRGRKAAVKRTRTKRAARKRKAVSKKRGAAGGKARSSGAGRKRSAKRVMGKTRAKTKARKAAAKSKGIAAGKPRRIPKAAGKKAAAKRQPRTVTMVKRAKKETSVGKAKKATMNSIREALLKRREYLMHNLGRLTAAAAGDEKPVGDRVDDASLDLEADSTYSIAEHEAQELRLIDVALEKIAGGTYGICEECGERIEKPRLKALPYAVLCLKCKQAEEVEHVRTAPTVYGDYEEE